MESAKDVGKNVEMNKYQEALDGLKQNFKEGFKAVCNSKFPLITLKRLEAKNQKEVETLQELADKATPKKPIKLEIIDLDEIIMPEYTNTIDKYMCDNCGLTWFIVDGHTYQHKYCKQCGQAIDWSTDEC